MSIHNSLKTNLPVITPETSVYEAVELLRLHHLSHLPIFNFENMIGLLPREVILSAPHDEKIIDYLYDMDIFFAKKEARWEEVMEIFVKYDSNIVPVLNEENQYLGYYQLVDFIHLFSETPFLREVGSFIVLEKNQEEYSFSEISQIVESNHAKILGMFISEIANGKVHITLKIISNSLTEILQTFRRYQYAILVEKEDDFYLQELKEKSNYFDKYLNI
ncbi:CBS domain-containing protein [Capnocytophaga cynodegmi]|uniref:CBS domain-containing protein n=1 Tax=Capnocytophaga cynodegmi TaxID=28189 RepID=UPI00385E244B